MHPELREDTFLSFDAFEMLLKSLLMMKSYHMDLELMNEVQNRLCYFLALHTALIAGTKKESQDLLIDNTMKEFLRVRTLVWTDAMQQHEARQQTIKGNHSVH